MESRLCRACQNLFSGLAANKEFENESLVHHSDLSSFVEAVKQRCHMCYMLEQRFALGDLTSRPGKYMIQGQIGGPDVSLYFKLVPATGQDESSRAILKAASFDVVPCKELDMAASRYKPTKETFSENGFDIAQKWMEECIQSHDYCSTASVSSSFFPTRILDLDAGQPAAVNLVLSGQDHLGQPYATLSHCWGKHQILKLEKAKIQQFCSGIPITTLPQTFQDAITACRRLGLRYLWIDSLCIVQDDKDDWLRESAVMGDVYRYGRLNLAATAASSGAEGMNYTRDKILAAHLRVMLTWSHEAPRLRQYTPAPSLYYLVERDFWVHDIDRAPLNRRGWVLQERLLAPRILHFGRNQLYWQCGLSAVCEMFPTDLGTMRLGVGPDAFTERDLRPFTQVLEAFKRTPSMLNDLITAEEAYSPWRALVASYTAMDLTKGEDKLIAIQALAQTMQVATRDRYLAGIWESRIAEDILWRVQPELKPNQHFRRPRTWRAPTWSWASIDGSCKKATLTGRYAGHKQFDGISLIKDIRANVAGYNDLETGQLTSASLSLKGVVLEPLHRPLALQAVVQEQTNEVSHFSACVSVVTINLWPDELDWGNILTSELVLPPTARFLIVGHYRLWQRSYLEGLVVQGDSQGNYSRLGYYCLILEHESDLQRFAMPIQNANASSISIAELDLPLLNVVLE